MNYDEAIASIISHRLSIAMAPALVEVYVETRPGCSLEDEVQVTAGIGWGRRTVGEIAGCKITAPSFSIWTHGHRRRVCRRAWSTPTSTVDRLCNEVIESIMTAYQLELLIPCLRAFSAAFSRLDLGGLVEAQTMRFRALELD